MSSIYKLRELQIISEDLDNELIFLRTEFNILNKELKTVCKNTNEKNKEASLSELPTVILDKLETDENELKQKLEMMKLNKEFNSLDRLFKEYKKNIKFSNKFLVEKNIFER